MVQKTFNFVFWIFILESVLLVIGIEANVITYGIGVATPYTKIGIIIGIIAGVIFKALLRDINNLLKKVLAALVSLIMMLLCFYYVLEDQFEILFRF